MQPFQTILLAADFSESSREAFRTATAVAVEGHTRLHILHVVEPHWVAEEPAGLGQAAVPFYPDQREARSNEALRRKLCNVYAPDRPLDVDYQVREGDVAGEILRRAEEIGADLIVVGTHGRTGLSWLLAGSVATAVLRRAHCPVLALHCLQRPSQAKGIRAILHPTDFSENSESALHVARALARDLGARLILLHVAPFDLYLSDMVVPVDARVYRDALEEVRGRTEGPDLKDPVEIELARGDAAEEIVRKAAERECGLIVMGTHGRTGLRRLLMGSVAEYVLPRTASPVLVVKGPQSGPAPTAEPQPWESLTAAL